MRRFWTVAALAGALVGPMAVAPLALQADDRVYRDQGHNDEHHWDSREDRAYRAWVKENHRKYRDFRRLNHEEQERYWAWRHEHRDVR